MLFTNDIVRSNVRQSRTIKLYSSGHSLFRGLFGGNKIALIYLWKRQFCKVQAIVSENAARFPNANNTLRFESGPHCVFSLWSRQTFDARPNEDQDADAMPRQQQIQYNQFFEEKINKIKVLDALYIL
jgi:hypothetical protein